MKKNTNVDKIIKFLFKYKYFLLIGIVCVIICLFCVIPYRNKTDVYLELLGDKVVTIYQGDDYVEPGYEAYNADKENLLNKVEIKSDLKNDIIGEYKITYTLGELTDTRVINVIEKPTEYTFIYLNTVNNSVNVYLKKGDTFTEPGYQAYSSIGDDLTSDVIVSGNVDSNKKGTYKMIYSVIDSNGVTISTTRTVIVMDSEISLTLENSNYTNNDVNINAVVIDEYFDYMVLPDNTKVYKNTYSYNVNKNGKYTFKVYSKLGMLEESSIEVKNIDKEVPNGSCSGSYKDGISTIDVNAKDNIGISKYVINNHDYTSNMIAINSEMETVNVTIYDKAGNTKNISCKLEEIKPDVYYQREFSVKYYDSKSGKGLSYWLYIPEGATDNMPLIIYLHGSEGKGNDYKNNTRLAIQHGPGSDVYHKRREYNAIMIMPQVRANSYLNMDELMELIDYVANTYKVNKKKISLSGMSEGANQISTKIGNYASYFSSIVLLGNYVSNPDKFVSVPVITMCGGLDSGRNYSMQKFVKEVNQLGGNAVHYTIEGKEHNIVGSSYSVFRDEKYNLSEWMISQTKK